MHIHSLTTRGITKCNQKFLSGASKLSRLQGTVYVRIHEPLDAVVRNHVCTKENCHVPIVRRYSRVIPSEIASFRSCPVLQIWLQYFAGHRKRARLVNNERNRGNSFSVIGGCEPPNYGLLQILPCHEALDLGSNRSHSNFNFHLKLKGQRVIQLRIARHRDNSVSSYFLRYRYVQGSRGTEFHRTGKRELSLMRFKNVFNSQGCLWQISHWRWNNDCMK